MKAIPDLAGPGVKPSERPERETNSDSELRLTVKMRPENGGTAAAGEQRSKRTMIWDFKARGEPFLWGLGGALAVGILMIIGFIALILSKGIPTFYPEPIEVFKLRNGSIVAGEIARSQEFRPGPEFLANLDEKNREQIAAQGGLTRRTLVKTGNFDLYNEDYKWVYDYEIAEVSEPADMFLIERM